MQLCHQIEDTAIGEHNLQPQAQGAGGAIAQHVGTAGIGGKHTADHGRAARAEPEREVEALSGGGIMKL